MYSTYQIRNTSGRAFYCEHTEQRNGSGPLMKWGKT